MIRITSLGQACGQYLNMHASLKLSPFGGDDLHVVYEVLNPKEYDDVGTPQHHT